MGQVSVSPVAKQIMCGMWNEQSISVPFNRVGNRFNVLREVFKIFDHVPRHCIFFFNLRSKFLVGGLAQEAFRQFPWGTF